MRLIDVDALLNDLLNSTPIDYRNYIIEPELKMHGRWIENDNGTFSCNMCHSWIPKEQRYYARYCLYCGADMQSTMSQVKPTEGVN